MSSSLSSLTSQRGQQEPDPDPRQVEHQSAEAKSPIPFRKHDLIPQIKESKEIPSHDNTRFEPVKSTNLHNMHALERTIPPQRKNQPFNIYVALGPALSGIWGIYQVLSQDKITKQNATGAMVTAVILLCHSIYHWKVWQASQDPDGPTREQIIHTTSEALLDLSTLPPVTEPVYKLKNKSKAKRSYREKLKSLWNSLFPTRF